MHWTIRSIAAPLLAASILTGPVVAQDVSYQGYEEELAAIRAQFAATDDPGEKAYGHSQIGLLLFGLNRYEEGLAEVAAGKALLRPGDDIPRGELLYTEAFYFQRVQRYAECEANMRQAQPIYAENYGEDHPYLAMIESLLAGCLQPQGKYGEAIELTRHADFVFAQQGPEYGTQRANALITLAQALQSANMMVEAEELLRLGLIPAREMPEKHPIRHKVVVSLGLHLLGEGRALEASQLLREALLVATENPGITPAERGANYVYLANAYLQLDRPDQALDLSLIGIDLLQQDGADLAAASQLGIASAAADRIEDLDQALALQLRGLKTIEAAPESGELRLALAQIGIVPAYVHAGKLDEAEAISRSVAEVLGRLRAPNHRQATAARIQLAWVLARQGKLSDALALAREGFATSTAALRELEYVRNRPLETLPSIVQFSQALEVARIAGDNEFAFEVMQAIIQSDASRAAFAVAARESAANSQLGALLRQRQEAGAAVAQADTALLEAQARDAADIAALSEVLAGTRTQLEMLETQLDQQFPAFRDLIQPRAATLAQMQASLADNEALLVMAESDQGLYTMAITRDGADIGRDPTRRESLRKLVQRIRSGVDATLLGGAEAPFDLAGAAQLHDAIFTPDIARAVAGKPRLLVASGDILSALPLSVLVSRKGEGVMDSRFLIDDKSLSVVPSFAALAAGQGNASRGGHLVAVGAPALQGGNEISAASDYYAPGVLRSVRLGQLAPLPLASAEMHQVASLLANSGQAIILEGAAANEPAVKALDLTNVGVLLFATHGLVAGSFDGNSEPALVLTPPEEETLANDGLLTASEAALLDIGADWVILSACDTAAGGRPSAAGYTGLARGFLFAGARRVVASHWPVRDDVSAAISAGLVAATQGGASSGEALRTAILAVKAKDNHPAYWAPFMVVAR